jgi:hypothetical protein
MSECIGSLFYLAKVHKFIMSHFHQVFPHLWSVDPIVAFVVCTKSRFFTFAWQIEKVYFAVDLYELRFSS